jgi:hypothetical protein
LPLLDVTREFLTIVETETGYPVKLLEEPNLPTFAVVRMARNSVPAHFVQYKPTHDESLDYLICFQCAFILRLFENPPEQRFDLAGAPDAGRDVFSMLSGPSGTLEKYGLQRAQLEQMAATLLGGLMTHLRSVPIGMRIADWIHASYPALHASQRATVLKELAEAQQALQPSIREMTPDPIFAPTLAINAAFALFWAGKYGTRELFGPYRGSAYDAEGRALLKIWQEVPSSPLHDRELIDRWGARLGLTQWYRWAPYVAP